MHRRHFWRVGNPGPQGAQRAAPPSDRVIDVLEQLQPTCPAGSADRWSRSPPGFEARQPVRDEMKCGQARTPPAIPTRRSRAGQCPPTRPRDDAGRRAHRARPVQPRPRTSRPGLQIDFRAPASIGADRAWSAEQQHRVGHRRSFERFAPRWRALRRWPARRKEKGVVAQLSQCLRPPQAECPGSEAVAASARPPPGPLRSFQRAWRPLHHQPARQAIGRCVRKSRCSNRPPLLASPISPRPIGSRQCATQVGRRRRVSRTVARPCRRFAPQRPAARQRFIRNVFPVRPWPQTPRTETSRKRLRAGGVGRNDGVRSTVAGVWHGSAGC